MMWAYAWLALGLAACAAASSEGDLTTLSKDYWNWRLKQSPQFSTTVGSIIYNDVLDSYNLTDYQRQKDDIKDFETRLLLIDKDTLTYAGKINYAMLIDTFTTFAMGYRWVQYGPLNPINFLEGMHTDPATAIGATPFKNQQDFENYIERLKRVPNQINEQIALFKMAIAQKHTYNNVSVAGVHAELEKLFVSNASESVFYSPFKTKLDKIMLNPIEQQTLRDHAMAAITLVIQAYLELDDFIINTYMPQTRTAWGVDSWSSNGEYYKACLKWHTSTDMTPEEVHKKGLDEVRRITAEMKKIMDKQGFKGSVRKYFDKLKMDHRFTLPSKDALLKGYEDLIFKRVLPKIKDYFENYPNLPVRVEAMAYDGPGGQYFPVAEDGSRPGVFQVNLIRPNDTKTYDMPALTLHETIPGHHLQISYAVVSDLPEYRKNDDYDKIFQVPFQFPFYTAYTEGWALYAEYLGEEMGVYESDYELMGRYSSEMFRACRLVVDTGLHSKQWSRELAIQYMLDHTSYARGDMQVEIDRYITWPGQACGYKIGELKIKQLRKTAEMKLGKSFNLKKFHSVVLANGAVPLNILEKTVSDWMNTRTNIAAAQSSSVFLLSLAMTVYQLLVSQ